MGKPKFHVSRRYIGRRKNITLCQIVKRTEGNNLCGQVYEGEKKFESATAREFEVFGVREELFQRHQMSSC